MRVKKRGRNKKKIINKTLSKIQMDNRMNLIVKINVKRRKRIMNADKLVEYIAEKTGGKIIKTQINGVESEVIVGSSVTFPSYMTPRRRRENFWNAWENHYEQHQKES